jgi:hypothetical protein
LLVSTDPTTSEAKLLSGSLAESLQQLARAGDAAPGDLGLEGDALRVLQLDGTVSSTEPVTPATEWMSAATSEGSVSVEALRWAAQFSTLSSGSLAHRLYFFGRYPVTARRRRELPDDESVARWLGLSELEGDLRGLRPLTRTRETWVWRRWARPGTVPTAKLYVCCAPDDLPLTLRASVAVLNHRAVTGFKVGFDLPTVLRPDKFVVFLADDSAVEEVAEAIYAAVGPSGVQPLPFVGTTLVGPLVGHASDPDDWAGRPAWEERASWRLHICRLAAETLVAQRDRPWLERVAASLERLSLAGVDTRRWTWAR